MLLSCFSFHVFFYFGIRSERCCLKMCWKWREFSALGDWNTFPLASWKLWPPFSPLLKIYKIKRRKLEVLDWEGQFGQTHVQLSKIHTRTFYSTRIQYTEYLADYTKGNLCPRSCFSNFLFFFDLLQDKFEGKPGKISAREVNWVVTVWYTPGTTYKTQTLRSGHKPSFSGAHAHTCGPLSWGD